MSQATDLLPDRMLEQVETWTAWDRRAWEPGSILRLREISEASQCVADGVLSEGALTWLRDSLRPLIGQDAGLATPAIRSQLEALLRGRLTYGSQAQRQLDHLVEFATETYLENWRTALAERPTDQVERASRFVTTHVLDAGFHAEWLRSKTRAHIRAGATSDDLINAYAGLLSQTDDCFSGVVALLEVPEATLMEQLDSWLPAPAVAAFLRDKGVPGPHPRHMGGLRFAVKARDPHSAATQVAETMERLASRTLFTRGAKRLRFHPSVFFEDGSTQSLSQRGPRIEAHSLARTGVLYSAPLAGRSSSAIDDALQLASNLMDGSPAVAAAGAWASLESLLVTGADNSRDSVGRAVAADRAAMLVAASWPRAELTRLSHRLEGDVTSDSTLVRRLIAAGTENADRCAVLIDWIESGRPLDPISARDRAAVARMQSLIKSPRPVLGRVRSYMTSSLRRLYRQRNIVLHGGMVRPVALAATIRTSGPLVGAALDRISHAYELEGVDPLDAVARADCALKSVGTQGGWPLHQLTF